MKRNRLTSRLSALLVCLVLLATLLPTTAQASYSVYVNAKDGLGLNLRAGPGTEYATVRSSPVPMYTPADHLPDGDLRRRQPLGLHQLRRGIRLGLPGGNHHL